jgi:hypothetical protein
MKPFAKALAHALLAASALGAITQARAAEFILFVYESPTDTGRPTLNMVRR